MSKKVTVLVPANANVNTPTLIDLDGDTTGGAAAAGEKGEYLATTVATGSAVALTTATAKDVCSLALTPGDWEVSGVVHHKAGASTSVTQLQASISPTQDTAGTQAGGSGIGVEGFVQYNQAAAVPAADISTVIPPVRVSLSANATIHLVAKDTFTVSTMGAYGSLQARRIR